MGGTVHSEREDITNDDEINNGGDHSNADKKSLYSSQKSGASSLKNGRLSIRRSTAFVAAGDVRRLLLGIKPTPKKGNFFKKGFVQKCVVNTKIKHFPKNQTLFKIQTFTTICHLL